MVPYTFEELKALLLKSIREAQCEAELTLVFRHRPWEYMIIIYADHCSFQRCGTAAEQSGEACYRTLDELYRAQQADGLVLERDWLQLQSVDCFDFDLLGYW